MNGLMTHYNIHTLLVSLLLMVCIAIYNIYWRCSYMHLASSSFLVDFSHMKVTSEKKYASVFGCQKNMLVEMSLYIIVSSWSMTCFAHTRPCCSWVASYFRLWPTDGVQFFGSKLQTKMADDIMANALRTRHDQIKRWEDSDTNREPDAPRLRVKRVKFQDGCVFLAACSSGDREEVKNLLERGADINTANVDGLTALHQVSCAYTAGYLILTFS